MYCDMGYGYCCDTLPETHSFLTMQTCALMRFSYPADSGSTVFKMKDNSSFQACDFTDAEQIDEAGTLSSGKKHVDYPFDFDSLNTMHYFASQNGCEEGQKVAIKISNEYATYYDMCFGMGADNRGTRVTNCDCDGSKYRHATSEVCLTGYIDGCRSQAPDDLSCCNPDTVAMTSPTSGYFDHYRHGGNCIPKNMHK